MPSITLPPTVANGTVADPDTQWNTMRTALSKLPRGIMGYTSWQTSTAAFALAIGTGETSTTITTPAIATEAGRRYRIQFAFELRNGQSMTSYGTARIRRGTTTAGTIVRGPFALSDKSGTASRDAIVVEAIDVPGAQAAQQWVLTFQTDAGTVDIYAPAIATVTDEGAES